MYDLPNWLIGIQETNKRAIEDLDRKINDVAQQVLKMISEKETLKRQQQKQIDQLIEHWLISEKRWACAPIITYTNHIIFLIDHLKKTNNKKIN